MNIQHFGSEDIVTLHNPDTEDFEFRVSGKPYVIPAGGSKRFLGYMAELGVKHLVDKLMIKDGRVIELVNEESRKAYEGKIIVDAEPIDADEVKETEAERGARAFDRLNEEDVLPEDPEEADPEPTKIEDSLETSEVSAVSPDRPPKSSATGA